MRAVKLRGCGTCAIRRRRKARGLQSFDKEAFLGYTVYCSWRGGL